MRIRKRHCGPKLRLAVWAASGLVLAVVHGGRARPAQAAEAPGRSTPAAAERELSPDEVPLKRDLVLPEGVGPLRLGTSLEDARKAMPSLSVEEGTTAGAVALPFKYGVARLRNQSFGDLKGCEIALHFYRERLIYYSATCGDTRATRNYLLRTFGAPGMSGPEVWQWTGSARSMTFAPASGAIVVAENDGLRAYQIELMNLMGASRAAGAAPQAGGHDAGAAATPTARP